MEDQVLQLICDSQGAVNTDYLICNLGFGDAVKDIICNRDKFALCCPFGQPKVVARTRLRLCRAKDCPGSCRGLHLCKNFLLSGSCQFTRLKRGCTFSHQLDSDHNQRMLREHELQSLSRSDLCTLLLQSDNTLLPPICYDYNNGRCQDDACTRLHICVRYLNCDCSCFKTHDFNAPQPLKVLQDKGVPDSIIKSVKSAYANKEALRYYDRNNKGNKNNPQPNSQQHNSIGASGDDDVLTLKQTEWHRSRGRGGNSNRGNRGTGANRRRRGKRGGRGRTGNRANAGNQGNPQEQQQSCSSCDLLADINAFGVYLASEDDDSDSSTSNFSAAVYDSDSSSVGGYNRKQTKSPSKPAAGVRGRGGNGGNGLQRTRSPSDIRAPVNRDGNSDIGPNRKEKPRPVREKTEICMYFIKGHCKHEERCFKAHDKMPYRWEVKVDDQWTALPDNEAIEKDFCDPKNTYSSSTSPAVHFDTMTRGASQVRRLSTVNSLREPTFMHTTEWVWYWEDETGKWNQYASATAGHKPANMDSSTLEQKFLDNDKDEVDFTAGSQSYTLSFSDMIQTNKRYGTKRLVRRRPRFVSAADVRARRARKPPGLSTFQTIPDHWDKTQVPQTGFKRIPIQRSSEEFKEVEALFCKTMKGFDILKLERIQNKALWEVFQWQKTQMKNNSSGSDVTEKKLFHGTDTKYVDIISHTNFDWRLCGTHGTAFGKGSYFARDAKYSNSYTSDSDVKSMFVARVLVGDYTRGSPDYRRPPSKDGGDINFFDSCVDNVLNPSIFVVFEKHQIYPEYLLEYTHPLVDLYGSSSVPKPTPAPRPAVKPSTVSTSQISSSSYGVSFSQHTTSSYQSSTSSYGASVNQPSTPSYQPSTSSYGVSVSQPSTSSYGVSVSQPSTSSYRPSTASSQPSTPSYQPSTSSYGVSVSQSSTASSQPSTLSYNSRTSTYKYQPTQSSPSSSSTPKKKQSDSCVIA